MKDFAAIFTILVVLLFGILALVFQVFDLTVPPVRAQASEPTQLSTVELGERGHRLDIEVELKESWVELEVFWADDHSHMSWCLVSEGQRICASCEPAPEADMPEGLLGCYTRGP